MQRSIETYPPPKPPMLPPSPTPGVMVPFVYPPIPLIALDPYTNADELLNEADAVAYPVIAPLPFPPPNFMPYPLIADRAPPPPKDVFSYWLEALEALPRNDMVLASAAGSIHDLRFLALAAGLDVSKLDELVRLGSMAASDPEASDRSSVDLSDSSESPQRDALDYYENINTSNAFDLHLQPPPPNALVVESEAKHRYATVTPKILHKGKIVKKRSFVEVDKTDDLVAVSLEPLVTPTEKDIIHAAGIYKDRRREQLLSSVQEIDSFAKDNRVAIYTQKKNALLRRLRLLQSSRVRFDPLKSSIDDDELRDFADQRLVQNDEELMRLKMAHSYERLKTVLDFYQTTNKLYKTMNSAMINKLKKLKNFLEYQTQTITKAIESHGDIELTSIRNRDSSKLFNGFVSQDYASEIKEVFRAAISQEDGVETEENDAFNPALFRRVYTGVKHQANVHDLMPLITREEFRLITGEAPAKTGQTKDTVIKGQSARHHIFQSALYDRPTSGSDNNNSDNGAPVKRRPGRRAAPKPTYGEELAKQNNETALVAKIMKQFIGPGAATSDELVNDLNQIGIDTKWPIK